MAGGFESLGLMPELLRAVDEIGWNLPTDVQDEAIPLILGGGDVMAAAETGSGKTAAFCLPIIQSVHERLRDSAEYKSRFIPGEIIKINDNDRDSILVISKSGLSCSSSAEKLWVGGRATHGVRGGRFSFEVSITGPGICRVGWSTMAAHLELGKDSHGFGYGGTGMKSHAGAFQEYGGKFGEGDVVTTTVDWITREVSYCVNGEDKGVAFSIPESMIGTVLFPAFVLKGCSIDLNFGDRPFRHSAHSPGIASATDAHLVSAAAREAFMVSGKRVPMAIILEPARDLAEQVFNSLEEMSKHVTSPQLKSLLIVGGDESRKITRALAAGIDIIVGTLGKVTDMVKSKSLDLSQVRFFVLDEADRLTEAENMAQIMYLYNQCPGGGTGDNRLQVCFFSATLHSPEIVDLASKICINPTWVDLKGVDSVPESVHHVVYQVDLERDARWLQTASTPSITDAVFDPSSLSRDEVLRTKEVVSESLKAIKQQILLKIIDSFKMSQCMIFCRTNLDCDNLETFLCNHGGGRKFVESMESGKEHEYSCCVLGGMRSMNERRRNLEAFKEGNVRFLICTDVAARGIDIQGLPFMINMTLPDEPEHYIHRIGRVGRAERLGLAISIVASEPLEEKVWYHTCGNRGKGCFNRNLKENGGCTIWYNEPALLKAITGRLHMTDIPQLSPDFQLPASLASSGVEYGEEMAASASGPTSRVLETMGETVRELAAMEFEAQNIYLNMKVLFTKK